jgi:REP element-mobilizing transposase RayT
MVIAYHLVWTAYGTWLPNDPRGSGSQEVLRPELIPLGESHFGRRARQPARSTVREFYAEAEPLLKHDVIRFDAEQRGAVVEAFGEAIHRTPYTCWACAIMPDHVHVVIRKHRRTAEEMIEDLQAASRMRLQDEGLVPPTHPIWTRGGWKGFLDTPERVRRTVKYVEGNPPKDGLAVQRWPFVTADDGWLFGGRR